MGSPGPCCSGKRFAEAQIYVQTESLLYGLAAGSGDGGEGERSREREFRICNKAAWGISFSRFKDLRMD